MTSTKDFLWTASAPREMPCAPEAYHTGPAPTGGYPVDIKLERVPLEVDTSVTIVAGSHSSVSPPSAFTMDSDGSASSETDEDLTQGGYVEVDMKEEPEPSTPVGNEENGDQTSLSPPDAAGPSQTSATRRPRGRPPRDPSRQKAHKASKTHARSKTGCRTCRNRKKKCDEAKPECMDAPLSFRVGDGGPAY